MKFIKRVIAVRRRGAPSLLEELIYLVLVIAAVALAMFGLGTSNDVMAIVGLMGCAVYGMFVTKDINSLRRSRRAHTAHKRLLRIAKNRLGGENTITLNEPGLIISLDYRNLGPDPRQMIAINRWCLPLEKGVDTGTIVSVTKELFFLTTHTRLVEKFSSIEIYNGDEAGFVRIDSVGPVIPTLDDRLNNSEYFFASPDQLDELAAQIERLERIYKRNQ